jgi:hypothetical protein
MKTLMINDLPDVEVLDRVDMASITGGAIDQRLHDFIANVYSYTHCTSPCVPVTVPTY